MLDRPRRCRNRVSREVFPLWEQPSAGLLPTSWFAWSYRHAGFQLPRRDHSLISHAFLLFFYLYCPFLVVISWRWATLSPIAFEPCATWWMRLVSFDDGWIESNSGRYTAVNELRNEEHTTDLGTLIWRYLWRGSVRCEDRWKITASVQRRLWTVCSIRALPRQLGRRFN